MTKNITTKEERATEKKGRWKEKVYTKELIEYTNKGIQEHEKALYHSFFNSIREEHNIHKPNDLMMLDMACYDYVRIKRMHMFIKQKGDMQEYTTKTGRVIYKANEASYLLNSIQSQFRQNMKELLLTRKEQVKKSLGTDGKDFANWMKDVFSGEVVEAEVKEVENDKDEEVIREVREGAINKA